MEIRLLIFLIFIAINLIWNSVLIWSLYKAFAHLTAKLTDGASAFERSDATKHWIKSMSEASEQAAAITEVTKQKMREFVFTLDGMQAKHKILLASVDARLERVSNGIADRAGRVRNAVAMPAEKVAGLAEKIQNFAGFGEREASD